MPRSQASRCSQCVEVSSTAREFFPFRPQRRVGARESVLWSCYMRSPAPRPARGQWWSKRAIRRASEEETSSWTSSVLRVEVRALTLGHPGVDVRKVGDREIAEGGVVQVSIWPELGRHGHHGEAALSCAVPDRSPPELVLCELGRVFRRAWIGNLGPLCVADPGVHVSGSLDREL